MRSLRLVALVAALLVVAAVPLSRAAEAARELLIITTDTGDQRFGVEIADTPRERSRGLMYRRSMGDDEGMLFDFGDEEPASFWMHNTYIPLDMLFIKADGTIESIAKRTTPLSDRSIDSKGPVRYVLEINGGLSDKLHIAPGDSVSGPAIENRQ